MSLDLFGSTIAAADQNVAANAAPDLPAGFSEAFDVAWRSGTEFHNSAAYSIAQANALSEYSDNVRQKTGETLPTLGMHSEGNELNDFVSLDDFNAAQAKLKEKYPGLDYLTPLSEGDLNAMTLARMKRAHDNAASFANRETTWGGTAGSVLGSLAGGMTDPVMVATLPLGGAGEAGIAWRALEFAGISGGTEAASALINYGSREAAVPGSSKEIPGEVAAATLFGGVLGAGFGGLAKLLGHGAKPLPTSVRDEVNAATSEFQFHATNPFPTAAGEAAARDATVEATTSLVKGETVRAADNFEAGHVADYALAAKAKTPEELAIAGEQHLRPETFGEAPDVERFDVMPHEAEDAASYWDRRLETASPEDRAAFGATDGGSIGGLRLVEAPEGGIYTPDQIKTAKGERYFKALNADGDIAAEILVRVNGDAARIEDILVPGKPREDGRNALGAADLRAILRQFQEANPEIKKLTGSRVSGARMDGGYSLTAEPTEVEVNLSRHIPARDVTPEQLQQLAADPATDSAVLHNLEHIMAEKPDMEFSTQVRQADGSYTMETRKLSDVLAELDGMEAAGKELEACAAGLALAAE